MMLLSGDELEKRARQLGIDILGDGRSAGGGSMAAGPSRAPDYELQRRVQEAERSRRESWLWILAVISAIAALASAATAYYLAVRK
jgi:hypothetical protein